MNPAPFTDNVTVRLERAFERSLRTAAIKIREQAAGRTCSSCRYFAGPFCMKHMNSEGESLHIHSPAAVACGEHLELDH